MCRSGSYLAKCSFLYSISLSFILTMRTCCHYKFQNPFRVDPRKSWLQTRHANTLIGIPNSNACKATNQSLLTLNIILCKNHYG